MNRRRSRARSLAPLERRSDVVCVAGVWRAIAGALRAVPEAIFERLSR